MDDESVRNLAALDLEEVTSKIKGKGKETDEPSDADLALQLQQQEIERAKSWIADRQIAQSIHRAVQDDGAKIVILASEENNAAADRELACRLAGRPPTATSQRHDLEIDNSTISKLSAFNIEDDSDDDTVRSLVFSENDEAESSVSAATRRTNKIHINQEECVSCQEVKEVVEVSCKHLYCRDCIRQLFSDAIIDETLFPPRCCRQHIPVSMIRHFLNSHLTARFEQKAVEYGTLNRTYCCDPLCATFVDPTRIHGAAGTCPKPGCGMQTCIMCKREAHPGTCMRQNPFEDTIRLAEQYGWQRCQRCQNMVELGIGCNHITCRCCYQFCYECGQQWRTCRCAHFHPDRLLHRAQQIADRPQGRGGEIAPALPRRERVERIARDLEEQDDCGHHQWWRRIEGQAACEICNERFSIFILECPGCRLRACAGCKRNRL